MIIKQYSQILPGHEKTSLMNKLQIIMQRGKKSWCPDRGGEGRGGRRRGGEKGRKGGGGIEKIYTSKTFTPKTFLLICFSLF